MRKKGFTLTNYWDSRQITKGKQFEGRQQWNLGAVEKGKWIDFVYHAKWSYKSDGLLEAWKGGKLILRRKGANTFNDKEDLPLRWGFTNQTGSHVQNVLSLLNELSTLMK